MPDSNWNSIYRTWIAFGLLLFLLTVWFAWGLSADQTEQRIRGEQSAQRHIEYAEDRIDQECLTLEGVALRDCIHQEIEAARDHSRSEQDLEAQQDMAFFTKIMGVTAVVGLVLGIGSVALIFLTLSETQKLARDTREIGEAQVRAYVSVDNVNIKDELDSSGRLWARMVYKNTGQSPAMNVRHELQILVAFAVPKTKIDYASIKYTPVKEGANSASGQVGANVSAPPNFVFSNEDIPKDIFKDVSNGLAVIVVRGWIKYDDVFGRPRATHFCFHRDQTSVRNGIGAQLTPNQNSAD